MPQIFTWYTPLCETSIVVSNCIFLVSNNSRWIVLLSFSTSDFAYLEFVNISAKISTEFPNLSLVALIEYDVFSLDVYAFSCPPKFSTSVSNFTLSLLPVPFVFIKIIAIP